MRAGAVISRLHNNCSGKHAGMLAAAKHLGEGIRHYLDLEHPVQQEILEAVSIFCDVPLKKIEIGIDGCCAPNFAMPLTAMARGFLNLVSPSDNFDDAFCAAAKRIVASMLAHPKLIGGSERLDTILMQAAPGKLISKVGADGVWLCGILRSKKYPKGAAIALKIEDGDDKRARPVVAIEILRRLGILSDRDLEQYSPMTIKNRRGEIVGRVESSLKRKK